MSCNVEEEGTGSSLERISHELLIHRGDKDDEAAAAASTQQSVVTTSGETALNLAQGENWLRLVASLGTNSVLQDTQETAIGTLPFPSISSLSEIGTIDAPTEDCYVCIDVDGPYISIKDMRVPLSSQESEDEVFDICVQRRKQRLEKIAELADSQDTGIEQKYHALEALERRQLRMLHQGDCIVIRNNSVGPGSDLVLEYHQYKADESRANGLEMADESQDVEDAGIAAASGGTEASKPSDRPQTQPDPTPRLSDYQTAVESQPTQQSEEEESETSYEGDEAEATQVFARSSTVLSTQSPEKQRDSDDETAMDVDANEKEQTFMTPAGRESELVAQPQERSTGQLGAEIERKMKLSTQSNSSKDNTDEENVEQRGDGNRMSPIAEESSKIDVENEEAEATMKSSSADDKLDIPRSQASTTLDYTQGAEGSDDDDVTENREEEDAGSGSDALLDDDDITSMDVPKTPNKADSVSEIDATTEKGNEPPSTEKDELATDERGVGRPEANVGDEAFSDSSSITEIDEETTKPKLKDSVDTTTNESQGQVAKPAGEPAPSALDDDDITEPGDLISPRKGLVTAPEPAREKSDHDESPSTEQNDAEGAEPGALAATEPAGSDTGKQPHQEEGTATDELAEEGSNEIARHDRSARKVIEWESREDKSLSGPAELNQMDTKVAEAVVAETDEGKSSTDSSPPKECLSHTEETEVTNNMSSSVNRESPAEKEAVDKVEATTTLVEPAEPSVPSSDETAPMVNAETDKTETKEGEETTSLAVEERPSPEGAPVENNVPEMEATSTNNAVEVARDIRQADALDTPADQKQAADEPSARAETDHADNKESEESPDEKEASSTVDDDNVAEAKPPSRSRRDSRKKAAPVKEDGEDEDAVKPPAKKRARSARTKAKSETEKEPEHAESLSTPANKRAAREAGHGSRGSARKRTRGARTPTSGDEAVRVLMTGVAEGTKEKKMIASIGGVLIEKVEDAHTATHVIAGDDKNPLRRTPKLMIGICRTSNIVYLDWLIKSAKNREPLACKDFLLLKDKKAERQYGFKMRESLQRGEALRQNDTLLLSGYWVYVCDGVAGNKAPPEKELELIVDGAGGTWLSSIGARVMKDVDATMLIIISPEKPNKKKSKSSEKRDVEKAIKLGAQEHPASWLFDGIIRQKLDGE